MAAQKEILTVFQSHFGGAISAHPCFRTTDILVAHSWSKHQRGAIRLGVQMRRIQSE
jgi:hypothetical protein